MGPHCELCGKRDSGWVPEVNRYLCDNCKPRVIEEVTRLRALAAVATVDTARQHPSFYYGAYAIEYATADGDGSNLFAAGVTRIQFCMRGSVLYSRALIRGAWDTWHITADFHAHELPKPVTFILIPDDDR